jgi:hypothetical protein
MPAPIYFKPLDFTSHPTPHITDLEQDDWLDEQLRRIWFDVNQLFPFVEEEEEIN